MTYILKNTADKPQVHALIIGANDYDYLESPEFRGGIAQTLGLRSLKSPVASARTFCDWLQHDCKVQISKGSIRLLISGAEDNQTPTTENICDAVSEWFDMCNSNESNIAIFYFCGHGLMKTDTLLLAEDFGKNKNNPLIHSVNFTQTLHAMESCRARTQLFLIDACRQTPSFLLEHGNDPSRKPLAYSLLNQNPGSTRLAVSIYAAEKGGEANATPGEVSDFTKLLLDTLRGAAAERTPNGWIVTPQRLAQNIGVVSRHAVENAADEWHPEIVISGKSVENTVIHALSSAPTVPVYISFNPDAATKKADISVYSADQPDEKLKPKMTKRFNWHMNLEAFKVYRVDAQFPPGSYKPVKSEIERPSPPVWPVEIEVEV